MNKKWWKESVVYQIYPMSFKDSDGDGIGDLQGVISKLDYLKDLGIDVIWICPIYQSPNHDNGYDISDYCAIMDAFGTMKDFDELLAEAHARGIKLIMDLVVNHTSDEHPWFIESRSSKDSPKRDYYVWRQGKNGGPPNNWESFFSGSVWEYDEPSGDYYLHLFSKHQPDLNWKNPEVIEEIYKMVRWWLDKGIDGFRFDAIAHIVKAEGFPDADDPDNRPVVPAYQMFSNLEKVHDLLRDLNRKVLLNYDLMTVGETSGLGPEQALCYIGDERHELNMVFQFEHMQLDAAFGGTGKWELRPWNLLELKQIMSKWQTVLHGKGWNANYFNNHDQPRAVSRFGNDKLYRKESAKLLATFIHTLEGTPFVYQGEEIGMTNVRFDSIDDYRDVEILNYYEEARKERIPEETIMKAIWSKGRDNARTPMQWDSSPQAGFTSGVPWIRVNANYPEVNAEEAVADPDSVYHYYRRLIALRKAHEVIVYGDYQLLLPLHPEIYAYTRSCNESQLLVLLNFFERQPVCELPDSIELEKAELLLSNYEGSSLDSGRDFTMQPYEARVYRLS
ncbi:alpha-glucosidase [Paenibacillus aurantius]|uniref:oligo-1,6-glucosidase n=1 Tax=Paenibacillus aurantius TaxID=2918900 RepID=A0AA96LGU4_9BACL|nr:alpha-glucosidase [Paenibacillus aurantius]WNQ13839.1 alpha-glucosidase [Paenibacillus aurantius]